jgi:hypothetical protein
MKRTIGTNKRLYALFNELRIDKDTKETLVLSFTNERTEHSSEMTESEANHLLEKLENQVKAPMLRENKFKQESRRNIFKLMYDIGLINASMVMAERQAYINSWIKNKLKIDKDLNDLNIDELISFTKQLQAIRRNYVSKVNNQATLN